MSKYELDDNLVRAVSGTVWSSNVQLDELAAQLRAQIPIPVPTKIGAVVRTAEGVAVLSDPGNSSPWVLQMGQDYTWADASRIGRITEVLSEGVDL